MLENILPILPTILPKSPVKYDERSTDTEGISVWIFSVRVSDNTASVELKVWILP